ncbi:MAG TPA: ribosome-associated translation inhibitor RaiA [Candidatus Saccharimonadales bacterium]|nr:ribosome-associated translation inhibitor RaiA [Candidatus Saccharimonadales bacterium]
MLKLQINNIKTPIKDDLDKYVSKKLGKLDKYIPRQFRSNAHAEVFLKEFHVKSKKQCTCEVIMHLPGTEIAATETTLNIFAAVDIVEVKLKNQLKKYKGKHLPKTRILSLIRRGNRRNKTR